jgi:hypothetical protein
MRWNDWSRSSECAHGGDQGFARRVALETPEFLRRDHDDLIATVYGHMLGPFAADTAHELAKARLGVLEEPAAGLTIPRAAAWLWGFRHFWISLF